MDHSHPLYQLLTQDKPVLFDGAMGTMLNTRGISFDECFDVLNLTKPALVGEIHREYIEAGSQIILTNTFGANRFKLARHNLEDKLISINFQGVELARRVVLASFRPVLIAGDIGPLGIRLAPFGRVQAEEACQAFLEQITVLVKAGIDLLVIETMTDLHEILEAVNAAHQVAPNLPLIASMTFTRDDRTLLGDSPEKVAQRLSAAGADVIGVNCSGGPLQLLRLLRLMRQAAPHVFFAVKPNAGWPEQTGGRIMYPAGPDYFGGYARSFWQAGAKIIGGCCGTTPKHIAALAQSIQNTPAPLIIEEIKELTGSANANVVNEKPTQLAEKLAQGKFVVAVEMDPPRGLSIHKLLAGASLLTEAGVDVINVADSPMARMRMSPWAVCAILQRQVGIESVLHFPTRGRNLLRVQGDLLAAHALGVRNVFVVMGDPTSIGDYPEAMDNYDLAPSGLIKLISQGFNTGVDHAGAEIGQPTSFFIGCALNLTPPDMDREISLLQRKIKAGANFILSQPIYQAEFLQTFLDCYEARHGKLPIPLLVGILPLASERHAAFLKHEVPGITIPDNIMEKMEKSGDKGAFTGIEIALELTEKLKPRSQGLYIMPAFKRYDLAAQIVESVKK